MTNDTRSTLKDMPRNIWVMTATSFLTDISSEMILNILPLFLANVLGVQTAVIGLIEGLAETTASLLKVFSGWFSDKIGKRKILAVIGYGFSMLVKPLFYFANSWGLVLGLRFGDRVGKGIRTAPRDALIADSIDEEHRGLAFGLHRAGDTAGAMLGILIAMAVIWGSQRGAVELGRPAFQTVALISFIPALLAVLILAFGSRDVDVKAERELPTFSLKGLDGQFKRFIVVMLIFTLGNSADAFLILRAQERGLSVIGILAMLATFNLVYSLISGPAGALSDQVGRRRLIVIGWLFYGVLYLGFALAEVSWQIWALYALYGVYYGAVEGTAKAYVADLVAPEVRGTAYGIFNAAVGIAALPASLIAGLLWQGAGAWAGFGPRAPFFFGSALALLALFLLVTWVRPKAETA